MFRNINKKLESWKNKKNRKPLLISGARQVGKTYSLKKFGNDLFAKFHYLNFEEDERLKKIFQQDLTPKRILQDINFYVDSVVNINTDLIIFDEIQECPRAITSLKYFAEELPGLAICAAGSLLGLHLSESNFPVGKVEFLKMYPLSFEEFLLGIGDKKLYDFITNFIPNQSIPEIIHSYLWEKLKIYFIVGGLPEIILTYKDNQENLFTAFKIVREKQSNLILSYLADIAKHSGKENSMHIERIWRNISAQLSKTQNGSSPKFVFKGVIPGIKGYSRLAGAIDWLKTAGLIIKLLIVNSGNLPLNAYTEDNFFKLYFFDIGLLGAINKLSPKTILDYDYGTYKGYFAENFITQEFLTSGLDEFYCWRENTAEVEFVCDIDGRVLPVEIKSGWVTQAKSLKVFAIKYNPGFKVIFSANNINIDKNNNIYKLPIYLASKIHLL